MDVSAEAKRIMVQALSKMYSSRSQRGGLRLHRSLLLTLVMKSARDIYHSARVASENQEIQESLEKQKEAAEPPSDPPREEEEEKEREESMVLEAPPKSTQPELDQENRSPARADRHSRKRRGKTATEPDFLPCKRAKMDSGAVLRILQDATLRSNCGREADALPSAHMPRTVATC
ncbi:immediate early response gene 2 protein [Salminus brasiliensis]|uniref:immediate early response gene 2 protein n=1 Tax=Salminus brasiliensis TaxID=930266 RepID=UPI003B832FDB